MVEMALGEQDGVKTQFLGIADLVQDILVTTGLRSHDKQAETHKSTLGVFNGRAAARRFSRIAPWTSDICRDRW